jgi:Predicted kinase related to galactokinase and mevalonate kinase
MEKIACYSPLRVSFSGGGTDISPFLETYGSKVINTTIDRGVRVLYSADGYPLEISSRDFLNTSILGESHGRTFQERMLELFQKYDILRGRIYISGEVPPGSGLGSSSAIVTALMKLIFELRGEKSEAQELAQIAYKEEKEFFNITLGVQDPFAISLGGFKYMEFNGENIHLERLNESKFLDVLRSGMIICYTGSTRESSEVLKAQVRDSSSPESHTTNSLKELMDITQESWKFALSNDYRSFCSNVNRGWSIKRTLSPGVSSQKVENIISTALKSGARAARLLGGGKDGFVLVLGEPDRLWDIQKRLMTLSNFVVRVSPTMEGTKVISHMFQ